MKNAYIADTHVGHGNIIKYCQRPFASVVEMDRTIVRNLREAERKGLCIFHLGDVAMDLRRAIRLSGEWFTHPDRHIIIVGNHDRYPNQEDAYRRTFGQIVGAKKTWQDNHLIVEDVAHGRTYRLLLSHNPQRDLQGCDLNLHGHHHNNLLLKPEQFPEEEWGWLLHSDKHINVSAELLNYRPWTLEELLDARGVNA